MPAVRWREVGFPMASVCQSALNVGASLLATPRVSGVHRACSGAATALALDGVGRAAMPRSATMSLGRLLPFLPRRIWHRIAPPGHPSPGARARAAMPRSASMSLANLLPSLAARFWLRIARPGHPWPGVRPRARQCRASRVTSPGRSARRAAMPRSASMSLAELLPSLAARIWLRIARPGHPWPGVRARASQWLASAGAHPVFWMPAEMPFTVATSAWYSASSGRSAARQRARRSTCNRLIGSTYGFRRRIDWRRR